MPEHTTGLPVRPETRQRVDAIVDSITPPAIPDRVVRVAANTLGADDALPDLQRRLDDLAEQGGGRLELEHPTSPDAGVEPLTLRLVGPLHLRSRVELRLGRNLRLMFPFDPAAYAGPDRRGTLLRYEGTFIHAFSPLIRACGVEDVVLSAGPGSGARPTISGDGKRWEDWAMAGQNRQIDAGGPATYQKLKDLNNAAAPMAERTFTGDDDSYLRPTMINLLACRRVRVEGVALHDSPFWVVHPVFSTDLVFRDIAFDCYNLNNDGIDPDACTRVLIERVAFGNGDDNVAVKSGRDREALEGFDATGTELEHVDSPYNDGARWSGGTSEVVVRHCGLLGHHAICVGSEVSGGAHDIYAVDNRAIGDVKLGFFIKSSRLRGGRVHRVVCEAMRLDHAKRGAICINTNYDDLPDAHRPPTIEDIEVVGMRIGSTDEAIVIQGWPDAKIADVLLRDVVIDAADRPTPSLLNVERIVFDGVTIAGQPVTASPDDASTSDSIPAIV
jgi:polygalacturonase